jgi:hypothetical protein
MKIQDVLYIVFLISNLFIRQPKLLIYSGLILFFIAGILYQKQIFFTADRCVWYAVGNITLYLIILLFQNRKVQ